jgi:hypothetical protein
MTRPGGSVTAAAGGGAQIYPCDCKSYNGRQCYNCLNGAHDICEGEPRCNKSSANHRRNEIFELINLERDKQDAKWGALPRHLSDVVWLTILMEEVGECAQAILKRDWDNLKAEIIQVATVAVAWLEDSENHDNGSERAG